MSNEPERPFLQRIAPDMAAFGIGLATAYCLKWNTTDLVWSLWLCSLVLGYLTLLSAIGAGAYVGLHAIGRSELLPTQRWLAVFAGTATGLFFLGFFSVHFGGFHAVHSVFLHGFFPIEGMPRDGFGEAFMNPPLLWVLVFRHLMKPYGLFLVPAVIAERHYIFRPLITAGKALHSETTADGSMVERMKDALGGERNLVGDAMGRPYLNVVRMHLLIFFFAFCHALKVEAFLVYAVVYCVYFFPWRELKQRRLPAGNQTDAGDV